MRCWTTFDTTWPSTTDKMRAGSQATLSLSIALTGPIPPPILRYTRHFTSPRTAPHAPQAPHTLTSDDRQMGEGKADVVIGSDVVYDLTAATSVPRVIRSFLHPQHGVAIILLPAMRMVPLARPIPRTGGGLLWR